VCLKGKKYTWVLNQIETQMWIKIKKGEYSRYYPDKIEKRWRIFLNTKDVHFCRQ